MTPDNAPSDDAGQEELLGNLMKEMLPPPAEFDPAQAERIHALMTQIGFHLVNRDAGLLYDRHGEHVTFRCGLSENEQRWCVAAIPLVKVVDGSEVAGLISYMMATHDTLIETPTTCTFAANPMTQHLELCLQFLLESQSDESVTESIEIYLSLAKQFGKNGDFADQAS